MAKKDKDSKPVLRKVKREVRVLCRREREKEKRRQRLNRRREEKDSVTGKSKPEVMS